MKRTLIAAAVLSVAGAAQAAPAYLYNGTEVAQSVWITGFFGIYGCVSVDNSAGAVVNNTQVANLGGVSMSPTAQTYYKGKVTTSVDQTASYNNSSGSGYKYHDSTSNFSNTFAEGSASTKNKSHNSSSSFAASGGYGYASSAQQAHTTSAGGTINAGGALSAAVNGAAGWSASTTNGVTGTIFPPSLTVFSSGNAAVAGALNAAFTLGGYLQETTNNSSADAAVGQGAGYVYGGKTSASNSSSSKSQAYASYKMGSKESHSASDWGWSSQSEHDWGSTRVHGSVTEYVNTQVPGTSTASIGNGALQGATGNVGVNIASGIDNAQSNNASLASIDSGNVFGNAQVFSQQTSTGYGTINNFNLAATVGDNALAGATGNVGVNVASGLGNVQNNSLALVSSTPSSRRSAGGALVATDDSTQMADAHIVGSFNGAASLGAGALNGATGNIGVNIASGGGNLQHNGLAVASLKLGQ